MPSLHLRPVVCVVGAVLAPVVCGGAGEAGQPGFDMFGDRGSELVDLRLISESSRVVPGETLWLGITYEIEPGWHLYWNGANDTGAPMTFTVEVPEGFEAGEAMWPAPKRYRMPGDLLDYIYEHRVTLLVPVRVPPGLSGEGGEASFRVESDWVVCSDACIPGRGEATLVLPVATGGAGERFVSRDAPIIEQSRARLPRELPEENPPVRARWEGDTLHFHAPGAAGLAFYPKEDAVAMTDRVRQGEARGERMSIDFVPEDPLGRTMVHGIVEVRRAGGAPTEFYLLKIDRPSG